MEELISRSRTFVRLRGFKHDEPEVADDGGVQDGQYITEDGIGHYTTEDGSGTYSEE